MRAYDDAIEAWLERFNAIDVDGLTAPYHADAVNHQVVSEPVVGKAGIRELRQVPIE